MATNASYSSAAMGSTSSPSFSTIVDVNHPYYLHPSDNPGMQITTVILTESPYNQWNRSMEIALSSKLKLGFVDGTYLMPASNSSLLVHWIRCNHMVTSWILNSVSVDIRNSVVYMKSAREIWLDLEVRYAQSNVPKLFSLRADISHLAQGNLSIATYFTKFRAPHHELECISTKVSCSCGKCTCQVNSKLDTPSHDLQLSQFLMGLNEQYTAIRGQILLMKPLLSLSQCYALLLQEENQRSVHSSVTPVESVAMSVKSTPSRFSTNKLKKPNQDTDVKCDYYHMPGHSRDKCYCLHGYPNWHRLYGKPKPKPRYQNSNAISVAQVTAVDSDSKESGSAPLNESLGLSDGQCKQLLQYLQKSLSLSTENSTDNLSAPAWYPSSINSTQFIGPFMDEGPRDW